MTNLLLLPNKKTKGRKGRCVKISSKRKEQDWFDNSAGNQGAGGPDKGAAGGPDKGAAAGPDQGYGTSMDVSDTAWSIIPIFPPSIPPSSKNAGWPQLHPIDIWAFLIDNLDCNAQKSCRAWSWRGLCA
ncbi:hypothetical protein KSP39_PZI022782 [Platanthera zijinensis]|uniref:Uncharacterized protein n=1 Tax=Platanthera zijinensis TaxID=2320716 RepID=A0AAP0FU40_9ASPA